MPLPLFHAQLINWDNVKQSAVTVARDTAIDGTIGLDRLEVDEIGLDANDRRMLKTLIQFYNGGPVGIETLAAAIGEEAVTLEDVYEPYLMQINLQK